MAIYSLWKSEANEHYSERAGKTVSNDTYKPVKQLDKLGDALDAFTRAFGTSKPGTKIKLIATVPSADLTAQDKAQLLARIKELEAKLAS
jgi:hypothetical protein